MNFEWTIFQDIEMGICMEHRMKNGLLVDDVLNIDCIFQCPAYRTCPLVNYAG